LKNILSFVYCDTFFIYNDWREKVVILLLGRRLKELRGKRTQQEIADGLKISRARYSHYENDHVQPDNDLLQKMADLYKTTVDDLLGRKITYHELNIVKESSNNDAQTTIKLLEEQAERMGLSPSDPRFLKMLDDAFDLLRLARGQNTDK
jgi:transcriptional regulator with XRE-family HTH domain